MTTLKMHTPNLVDSNIERLAELFPNCVTEKPKTDEQGKVIRDMNGEVVLERGIDFELLKQELSHSVIDGSQERYRLDWVGKREAIVTANSPIAKTLRPCREESVDFETTGNLFIEGDNLEALKLLQESYLGKVKMIYIDPPYNTGNDFIYNDDFAADTAEFFERSGQVDGDGNRLVANTESNGRFHSDWLSMMYSRLKLARNLLSDDGVIFISIDDTEASNLKKICDEIYGSSNFLAQIIWERAFSPINLKKHFSESHDFIIAYSVDKEKALSYGLERSEEADDRYKNPDNDPRGVWQSDNFSVGPAIENKIYEITTPSGRKIMPPNGRCWLLTQDRFEEFKADKRIWFGEDGNNVPRIKRFLSEVKNSVTPMTIWKYQDVGHSQSASQNLKKLFDGQSFFTYPKPVELISRIVKLYSSKNDIVMDFFAGSSTTAHAVMQLNAEDGGNRKFIMVQIPEATDSKSEAHKAGYPTIAEISKERIRRAGAKIKADNADKEGINELDTGFRVLKIDTSNMNDIYYRPQDYNQDLLATLENNIKPDRSDEDLLFQFMLDTGVPLSLPIERTTINGHTIYQVGGNSLIASLDYIDANMVNDIAALNPLKFITSERAIATDSDKTNIKERFKQLSPHTDVRFI
nr:site-specific DNA-methyltransferase [Moraxella sp. CTOTU47616]